MAFNPEKHHRKGLRLKNYDYSKSGLYFMTLVLNNREQLFGEIICDSGIHIMKLNNAGLMVENWYLEMENKFTNCICREYIIMPDHFHCIIEILDFRRDDPMWSSSDFQTKVMDNSMKDDHTGSSLHYGQNNKISHATISQMMDWFKTMTTNAYIRGVKEQNWKRFNKRLWQARFHDRIIRTKKEYLQKIKYIEENPLRWKPNK